MGCRQKARKFREYWLLANDSEVGGYQKFWIALLGDVLGAENVLERIAFQVPVPMPGTTKFLDVWIPETKVLIEHKKRGVKLDAPQSGHGGKTPFEQAIEYNQARGYSDKARWIVTSNFDEIWVYDMDKPHAAPKRIFTADPKDAEKSPAITPATHINGYLMDAPDAWIESRTKPLCDVPPLIFGSMPNDGGHLSDWSDEARDKVIARYPSAAALFRPLLGSVEFINGKSRWCLWLKDASPAAIRAVPPVMEAVEKVREMRLASKREATRKLAAMPTLFGEIRQPEEGHYLLVPKVSSEKREYVPMGFFTPETICSDLVFLVPSATLYHFGVLTSSVHMAWMRAVAGRLKSDYRYSANIVYNNFPWPDNTPLPLRGTPPSLGGELSSSPSKIELASSPSKIEGVAEGRGSMMATISKTAKAILDARVAHPDCSLADLYDPLTMPPNLRAAHAANDKAVLAAYGLAPDTPEPEIVAHLFKLYAEMTNE